MNLTSANGNRRNIKLQQISLLDFTFAELSQKLLVAQSDQMIISAETIKSCVGVTLWTGITPIDRVCNVVVKNRRFLHSITLLCVQFKMHSCIMNLVSVHNIYMYVSFYKLHVLQGVRVKGEKELIEEEGYI